MLLHAGFLFLDLPMGNDLTVIQQNGDSPLLSPHPAVLFTPLGMVVEPKYQLSYEEWYTSGLTLKQSEEAALMFFAWGWGDWLNYGSTNLREDYANALELTGAAENTIRSYQWVASRIPRWIRGLPHLQFSHYKEVASVKDVLVQLNLLMTASIKKWSVRRIREEINGQPPEIAVDKHDLPPPATQADQIHEMTKELYELEQTTIAIQVENSFRSSFVEEAISLLDVGLVSDNDILYDTVVEAVALLKKSERGDSSLAQAIGRIFYYYKNDMTKEMTEQMDNVIETL